MMGKRLKEIFGLILINITLVSGSLNAETVYADTQAKIEIEKTEMPLKICVDEENKKTVLQIVAVGSIDGVEFEGGNTKGNGADLVIGSHTYIDDFEEQLIGHHPGDSVDVTVTFPEDYGKDELNGKEALFKVTVNGIYK